MAILSIFTVTKFISQLEPYLKLQLELPIRAKKRNLKRQKKYPDELTSGQEEKYITVSCLDRLFVFYGTLSSNLIFKLSFQA
jgi:hypothetical protein